MDYKTYLAKVVELTKKVSKPESHTSYPAGINSPARRRCMITCTITRSWPSRSIRPSATSRKPIGAATDSRNARSDWPSSRRWAAMGTLRTRFLRL